MGVATVGTVLAPGPSLLPRIRSKGGATFPGNKSLSLSLLSFRSLANNNLQMLPRDIFAPLDILSDL